MQKYFYLILVISSSVFAQNLTLNNTVKSKVNFITHTGTGEFSSYLGMNIKFEPIKDLFFQLDKHLGGRLNKKNARTEAHITVITPVEYFRVLKEKISMAEINDLALKAKIQDVNFKVECLGQGKAIVKNKFHETYYVVVSSPKIVQLREKVFEIFKERGGNTSQFDPHLFYPHITVGYTHKDLHLGPNGVKKGLNSCYLPIQMVN